MSQIDLIQSPPPDLAVAIDTMSSSLYRFAIYQALGVPEIWRYDGSQLKIYSRQAVEDVAQPHSLALPLLTVTDIAQFLESSQIMGKNALVKQFRQWIRQRL